MDECSQSGGGVLLTACAHSLTLASLFVCLLLLLLPCSDHLRSERASERCSTTTVFSLGLCFRWKSNEETHCCACATDKPCRDKRFLARMRALPTRVTGDWGSKRARSLPASSQFPNTWTVIFEKSRRTPSNCRRKLPVRRLPVARCAMRNT
jgi:hypothetical protein